MSTRYDLVPGSYQVIVQKGVFHIRGQLTLYRERRDYDQKMGLL